jgi:hypothetical protein
VTAASSEERTPTQASTLGKSSIALRVRVMRSVRSLARMGSWAGAAGAGADAGGGWWG